MTLEAVHEPVSGDAVGAEEVGTVKASGYGVGILALTTRAIHEGFIFCYNIQ